MQTHHVPRESDSRSEENDEVDLNQEKTMQQK